MTTPSLFTTVFTLRFRGEIVHGGAVDNLVSVPEQNGGRKNKRTAEEATNNGCKDRWLDRLQEIDNLISEIR